MQYTARNKGKNLNEPAGSNTVVRIPTTRATEPELKFRAPAPGI